MKTDWPYPTLFAHRGGGTLAPENTLAGLRKGKELGFRAVEFDVMLTHDGIAAVVHDPHLGRTVAGHGSISDLTYAQLSLMDAGGWHSPQYRGEIVPTLDAVVQFCCEQQMAMNIEIKPAPSFAQQTGIAVGLALKHFLANYSLLSQAHFKPLVSSFNAEALSAFRQILPAQPAGILYAKAPADWFALPTALACQAIHCHFGLLNKDLVRDIKARGLWLFCYTVNDPIMAQTLLDWGVDGFCTDRLDLFTHML
jgi:glycerophosphoryl diester phosphodiesterase